MKVLVACVKPCSGGHPEWHIEGDVRVPIKEDNWD